jgi:hypothetical protein
MQTLRLKVKKFLSVIKSDINEIIPKDLFALKDTIEKTYHDVVTLVKLVILYRSLIDEEKKV